MNAGSLNSDKIKIEHPTLQNKGFKPVGIRTEKTIYITKTVNTTGIIPLYREDEWNFLYVSFQYGYYVYITDDKKYLEVSRFDYPSQQTDSIFYKIFSDICYQNPPFIKFL